MENIENEICYYANTNDCFHINNYYSIFTSRQLISKTMNVQFVSNAKGQVTAVQLPLKEWKEVEQKLEAFRLATSIKNGYEEMQQIEKGKLAATTLDDFLNEL